MAAAGGVAERFSWNGGPPDARTRRRPDAMEDPQAQEQGEDQKVVLNADSASCKFDVLIL